MSWQHVHEVPLHLVGRSQRLSQLNVMQIEKKGQRPRVRVFLSRAALMHSGWLAESCDDRPDFGMATLTVGYDEAAVGCSVFAEPKGAGTVGRTTALRGQHSSVRAR